MIGMSDSREEYEDCLLALRRLNDDDDEVVTEEALVELADFG